MLTYKCCDCYLTYSPSTQQRRSGVESHLRTNILTDNVFQPTSATIYRYTQFSARVADLPGRNISVANVFQPASQPVRTQWPVEPIITSTEWDLHSPFNAAAAAADDDDGDNTDAALHPQTNKRCVYVYDGPVCVSNVYYKLQYTVYTVHWDAKCLNVCACVCVPHVYACLFVRPLL